MKGLLSRLVRKRRVWLLLGLPICAVIAISSVASISVFPPKVSGKSLGYAVAGIDLYVAPEGGLVNNQKTTVPQNFIEQTIALGAQMASPQLRDMMATSAGIPPDQLAVDGPLDLNQSIFQQQPDGEKRSSQILVQNAPYRVTINQDLALPEIGVTAQAPTPNEAIRLASASETVLSTYLAGIETRSETPRIERLQVSSLGPIALSDDSRSGVANVAVLTFLLSFALWSGLVVALMAIVRDLRKLRRGWTPERVSP